MIKEIFLKRVIEMAKIDQDLRFRAVRAQKRSKKGRLSLENYLIYMVDFVHGQRIKELIKKHGFPNKKSFGKDGMASFWLLIQHQDYDVELQKQCFKNCDFERNEKEYLRDRILINEGRQQMYGTQYAADKDRRNTAHLSRM